MKRLFLQLLLMCCLMPKAWAQNVSAGFLGGCSGGFVLSEVSGDHASGPDKPGVFASLFVIYPYNEYRKLGLELMYIQKGSRAFNDPAESGGGAYRDYKLNLHYAEMPVVLLWHPAGFSGNEQLKALYFETGISLAVLLSHQEYDMGLDIAEREAENRPFKPLELNIIMGIHYEFTGRWRASLRLNQSVTPFRPHGTAGSDNSYWWNWHNQFGQYHTLWSLGIRYLFHGVGVQGH